MNVDSVLRWSAAPLTVVAEALAALALAVVAAGSDRPGRVLGGLAAVLLGCVAARDALLRPTLEADAEGMWIRTGVRRRRVRWADLTAVRTDRVTRRLVTSRSLELDLGDDLVILPGRRLGGSPAEVADAIGELHAAARDRYGW